MSRAAVNLSQFFDRLRNTPIERATMNAVANEKVLSYEAFDVTKKRCWDITALPPVMPDNALHYGRHIEAKERAKRAADIIRIKKNMFFCFSRGEKYILTLSLADGYRNKDAHEVNFTFNSESKFGVDLVNYDLRKPLERAIAPRESLSCA